MLEFYDYKVTNSLEVPNEVCLCFHIAECQNRCHGCFSKELWESSGISLSDVYKNIMLAYSQRITCICFLGEGRNTNVEHDEFLRLCNDIHGSGFRTCLYSGRDCSIEEWMYCFDYIKIGSYKESLGDLSSETTNQRLYKKIILDYEDITHLFWSDKYGNS